MPCLSFGCIVGAGSPVRVGGERTQQSLIERLRSAHHQASEEFWPGWRRILAKCGA